MALRGSPVSKGIHQYEPTCFKGRRPKDPATRTQSLQQRLALEEERLGHIQARGPQSGYENLYQRMLQEKQRQIAKLRADINQLQAQQAVLAPQQANEGTDHNTAAAVDKQQDLAGYQQEIDQLLAESGKDSPFSILEQHAGCFDMWNTKLAKHLRQLGQAPIHIQKLSPFVFGPYETRGKHDGEWREDRIYRLHPVLVLVMQLSNAPPLLYHKPQRFTLSFNLRHLANYPHLHRILPQTPGLSGGLEAYLRAIQTKINACQGDPEKRMRYLVLQFLLEQIRQGFSAGQVSCFYNSPGNCFLAKSQKAPYAKREIPRRHAGKRVFRDNGRTLQAR